MKEYAIGQYLSRSQLQFDRMKEELPRISYDLNSFNSSHLPLKLNDGILSDKYEVDIISPSSGLKTFNIHIKNNPKITALNMDLTGEYFYDVDSIGYAVHLYLLLSLFKINFTINSPKIIDCEYFDSMPTKSKIYKDMMLWIGEIYNYNTIVSNSTNSLVKNAIHQLYKPFRHCLIN